MGSLRVALLTCCMMLVTLAGEAGAVEKLGFGLRDVIDTVEQSYRQTTDIVADFFQRSTLAESKRELRADGEMMVRTPSGSDPLMFRFEYFRPTRQEIVSDGRTMWFYMPESRKVIQSDVSFVFSNTFDFDPQHPDRGRAVNFLQGLGRVSKDFLITFAPDSRDAAGNYVLELQPRRATAFIDKIFMVVRLESVLNFAKNRGNFVNTAARNELLFPVLSTTVIDHQGNTTTMEFTNIKVNSRLSSSFFDFMIPPGAQVVRPPTSQGN